MQNQNQVDYSQIPPDLQNKLKTWQQNGQAETGTKTFQEIATMMQMAIGALSLVATTLGSTEQKTNETAQQYTQLLEQMKTALSNLDNIQKFDEVLQNMSDTLTTLKDVERPQFPDYAAPIVEQLNRLETSLMGAVQGLDTKPNISVSPTPVSVQAPKVNVDLGRIESLVKNDLPKAFDKSIKALPEPTDNQPIVDKLEQLSEQLVSLETATRLKPQMGSVDVKTINGGKDLPVSQKAATMPPGTEMQNRAVANGNGDYLDVHGYATAIVQIVSSTAMSGGTTVNFEASLDNTNWVAVNAHSIGSGTLATTTTAEGDFRINVAGYKSLRARISAYSAGATTIIGFVTPLSAHPTTVALATGTNSIGNVGDVPLTSGGLSELRSLDVQTTATTVKASAGQIYGWYIANNASSVRYVKFYNKTGATSADTPFRTLPLPANSASNVHINQGVPFATACSIRGCTGVADNDNTAPTANDLIANIWYF